MWARETLSSRIWDRELQSINYVCKRIPTTRVEGWGWTPSRRLTQLDFFFSTVFSLCPHLLPNSFIKYHSLFCVWGNHNTWFQWLAVADNKQASRGNSLKSLRESQLDLSRVGLEGAQGYWDIDYNVVTWKPGELWQVLEVFVGDLGHHPRAAEHSPMTSGHWALKIQMTLFAGIQLPEHVGLKVQASSSLVFFFFLWNKFNCLQSPEEPVRSPGASVTGSCELPGVGAGNQSCAVYKRSSHS